MCFLLLRWSIPSGIGGGLFLLQQLHLLSWYRHHSCRGFFSQLDCSVWQFSIISSVLFATASVGPSALFLFGVLRIQLHFSAVLNPTSPPSPPSTHTLVCFHSCFAKYAFFKLAEMLPHVSVKTFLWELLLLGFLFCFFSKLTCSLQCLFYLQFQFASLQGEWRRTCSHRQRKRQSGMSANRTCRSVQTRKVTQILPAFLWTPQHSSSIFYNPQQVMCSVLACMRVYVCVCVGINKCLCDWISVLHTDKILYLI